MAVSVRLREPENRLVSTREALGTVQPVLEIPNNAIAQVKTTAREELVQQDV